MVPERTREDTTNRSPSPSLESREEWARFLSGLVHELRTPLASLGMITELLDKDPRGDADEKEKRYTGQLAALAREIQVLVGDAGTLARLAGGRTRVTPGTVILGDLVDRVVEGARPHAWDRGISLSAGFDADPAATLSTDGGHLEDALARLLETAVALADRQVTLRVALSGPDAVFTVEPDRGCGPQDELDALFDPFGSRVSRNLKQKGARVFAPLLAREHARVLGGDVRLESAGERAVCVLRVPRRAPER